MSVLYGHRSKHTHNEYELEVVDERPFHSIAILFVFLIGGPAFYQCFTDEGVYWRGGRVRERGRVGGERAGPKDHPAYARSLAWHSGKTDWYIPLCDIEQ